MQTVGIKSLKSQLSEYLRLVAAGETVRITDRGRVVAEIVPVRDDASTPEERWADLIRRGVVTPPSVSLAKSLPAPLEPVTSLEELLRDLDDSRSDR